MDLNDIEIGQLYAVSRFRNGEGALRRLMAVGKNDQHVHFVPANHPTGTTGAYPPDQVLCLWEVHAARKRQVDGAVKDLGAAFQEAGMDVQVEPWKSRGAVCLKLTPEDAWRVAMALGDSADKSESALEQALIES